MWIQINKTTLRQAHWTTGSRILQHKGRISFCKLHKLAIYSGWFWRNIKIYGKILYLLAKLNLYSRLFFLFSSVFLNITPKTTAFRVGFKQKEEQRECIAKNRRKGAKGQKHRQAGTAIHTKREYRNRHNKSNNRIYQHNTLYHSIFMATIETFASTVLSTENIANQNYFKNNHQKLGFKHKSTNFAIEINKKNEERAIKRIQESQSSSALLC